MEAKRRTPRTDLTYRAIIQKMVALLTPLALELDLPEAAIDDGLEQYAWLSARVSFEKDEVDFQLARPADTSEEVRLKFFGYLDTACMEQIDTARKAIRELDTPRDLALAPDLPEGAPKN